MVYRNIVAADYDNVASLWSNSAGICLRDDDSAERVEEFLLHNAGLSFLAEIGGKVVGAVLCGCDGKRGFLYHLAVDDAYRGQGIGKNLVELCCNELQIKGIPRCHIFVEKDNVSGEKFWQNIGWKKRSEEITLFTKVLL